MHLESDCRIVCIADCTVAYQKGNCNGCAGGSLACGFNYVKHNGLSDSNSAKRLSASRSGSYSPFADYKGTEGTCKRRNKTPLIREFASYYQDATIEDIQAWLYLYGPIAVGKRFVRITVLGQQPTEKSTNRFLFPRKE